MIEMVWIVSKVDDNRRVGIFDSADKAVKCKEELEAIYGKDQYYVSRSIVE